MKMRIFFPEILVQKWGCALYMAKYSKYKQILKIKHVCNRNTQERKLKQWDTVNINSQLHEKYLEIHFLNDLEYVRKELHIQCKKKNLPRKLKAIELQKEEKVIL